MEDTSTEVFEYSAVAHTKCITLWIKESDFARIPHKLKKEMK